MIYALILSAVIGYLIGSINSSIVLSKLKKSDIREKGSGNAGATNTLRVMGKTAAVFVVLGDVLKVIITILLGAFIARRFSLSTDGVNYCRYIAALFTVLGHNFPVFFGFRGGKGILTSTATIFMLDWRIGLIVLFIGVMLIVLTRYVSVGSLSGCVLYPLFVLAFNSQNMLFYQKIHFLLALVLGLLGIWRHRSNIKKLIKGTESKIGEKVKDV